MRTQRKTVNKAYETRLKIVKKNTAKLGLKKSNGKLSLSDKSKLKSLDKSAVKIYGSLAQELGDLLYADIEELCDTVVQEFEGEADIYIEDKDSLIQEVIDSVVLGLIYNTNWTLSDATDKISRSAQDLISKVIADGIEAGKSESEIIDDILAVIDPDAKNPSYVDKHRTIYTGVIDYRAQRLVKTTLQHAFEKAIADVAIEASKQVEGKIMIRWISALAANTCPLCLSRHGKLYAPEDLPLDHPNGQCTFRVEIY